jgi:ribose transport system substrate-binding protein
MQRSHRGRGVTLVTLAFAVSLAVVLAATIGSGSARAGRLTPAAKVGAGTNGVQAADARLEQYSGPQNTFKAPGAAFKGAKLLRGKTIWYVPIFLEADYFEAEESGLAAALKPLGAKLKACNGADNPSSASNCITEAVTSKAAGIITSAIPVAFAQQAYTDAVDHHIPVVAAQNVAAAPSTKAFKRYFVGTKNDESLTGDLLAASIIANSDGHANVLFADDTTTALTTYVGDGLKKTFAADCPDCKVTTMTFQDTELQNVPTQVQTATVQDPGVQYVVTQYDDPSGLAVSQGATAADPSIKFVASGGTPSLLQRVAQGSMLADIGADPVNNAWNQVDALLRIVADRPSVAARYVVAHRVFTPGNLKPFAGQLNSLAAASSGSWYSNVAFKKDYLKLWGVS